MFQASLTDTTSINRGLLLRKSRYKEETLLLLAVPSFLLTIQIPSLPLTRDLSLAHALSIFLGFFSCDHVMYYSNAPASFIANYILTRFWVHSSLYWILVQAWHWQKGFLELRGNFAKWQFSFRAVSLNGIFDKMGNNPWDPFIANPEAIYIYILFFNNLNDFYLFI